LGEFRPRYRSSDEGNVRRPLILVLIAVSAFVLVTILLQLALDIVS